MKKLLFLIAAFALLIVCMPALAEGGTTEVTANAAVDYVLVLPAVVDFGTIRKNMEEQERSFEIKIEGALLEPNGVLTVENITDDMHMYLDGDTEKDSLAFALAEDEVIFEIGGFSPEGQASYTNKVSCIPADLNTAGAYSGSMTFKISYDVEMDITP